MKRGRKRNAVAEAVGADPEEAEVTEGDAAAMAEGAVGAAVTEAAAGAGEIVETAGTAGSIR
jgi:hypothetical protein